ncbi:MAG: hypothetical protein ACRD0H_03680, partial [Actinomycetes bacterium]
VIYRQDLEHAIAMGEYEVIRPHRCPGCKTFGLQWVPRFQRAICPHQRCRDEDGMVHRWDLSQLAHAHIQSQKLRRLRAT